MHGSIEYYLYAFHICGIRDGEMLIVPESSDFNLIWPTSERFDNAKNLKQSHKLEDPKCSLKERVRVKWVRLRRKNMMTLGFNQKECGYQTVLE